ncbi:MAG TPA: tetratricopeptide repeat protein [Gemmataceae bacterium]|jgi:tetratricopeptide (TPR) repeat protein
MRRGLMLAWLVAGAGCTIDPGAAQQTLIQADMRLLQKDYRGAVGLYDQALVTDPTLREAYLHRGVAYRGNGNFDRALVDLDKAIDLEPRDARAYAERARTRLEQLAAEAKGDKVKLAAAFAPDDPLGVAADLERAVTLDGLGMDGAALLLHGAVRIMQNRDDDAKQDFERFLRRRSKLRPDLEMAIERWKKDRPVLDLGSVDELSRYRPSKG